MSGFDTFDIGEGLTSDKYYIHCMDCNEKVNRFYVHAVSDCIQCKTCGGDLRILQYAGEQ